MIVLSQLRKDHDLTMDQMAAIIGTTRQTYSRIEKGESDISLGQAVRLTQHFDIDIDNFISTDISCETRDSNEINRTKYGQIIQQFIKQGTEYTKITKTKLAKLCYLLDFAWYYEHGESITGLQYRRIQQGPVPDAYFYMLDMLEEDGLIDIEQRYSEDNGHKTYLISNVSEPNSDCFTTEEKELIAKIATKRKSANNKKIVDFTHDQLPWKLCDDKELIPYELIIQEDPDHVY